MVSSGFEIVWNKKAAAFQCRALYGYLRLRWLLPTSIWPVTICNNYVAVVKFDMLIPFSGVLYDPLRGYHGFRWNLNASAFQYCSVYGYLRLRWLLPTSIWPVSICNNYVAVVKLCMPIPCNGVEYDLLCDFYGFRCNCKASDIGCWALFAHLTLRMLLSAFKYTCYHLP